MKRPWNLVNSPVYSLATYGPDDSLNMNICTYVTPISLKPKLYAIAAYHGSQTLNLLQNSTQATLQFLTHNHLKLINPLGKRSGKAYDKQAYLEKKDWLTTWKDKKVLKKCAAYVLLNKLSYQSTGDHDLYLFEVAQSQSIPSSPLLTTQTLVEQKLIL